VDGERTNFIETYFHVNWPDRAIYHAMLNTALGDATVVETIVSVLKSRDPKLSASA
jgi:hypothetical protein